MAMIGCLIVAGGAAAAAAVAWSASGAGEELGRVAWSRDLDAARAVSHSSRTPLMVLTVPARGTPGRDAARALGRSALSHPIVVAGASAEFVAAVRHGAEATVSSVHFEDSGGRELSRCEGSDNAAMTAQVLAAMRDALAAAGRPVPEYLRLVAGEYNPSGRRTAAFAVGCYWTGESELGRLDGVIATRTGSAPATRPGGRGEEVIEVEYDPALIDYDGLLGRARAVHCFRGAYAPDEPGPPLDDSNQQQYHLWLHKPYHYLPLTRLQAARVNAALRADESPDRFLSPGQVALKDRMRRLAERDWRALDALEGKLDVDRSPEGLPTYAKSVDRAVSRLE